MTADKDTRFSGLLDAEDRHRAAPYSFSIPRSDVRLALHPGDVVKLLFGFGDGERPAAERMWVEIAEVTPEAAQAGGDRYVGRLLNTPEVITDLAEGARVAFGHQHVAAIWRDVPGAPAPGQFAIVSERIWRGGQSPMRASRLPVPDTQFSGWVVQAAEDAAPPPADLSGYLPVSHAELTDRYRILDSIEDEPAGTAWRWDADELEWQRDPAGESSRRLE